MLAQLWSYLIGLAPSGNGAVKMASQSRQRSCRSLKTVAASGGWPTTLTRTLGAESYTLPTPHSGQGSPCCSPGTSSSTTGASRYACAELRPCPGGDGLVGSWPAACSCAPACGSVVASYLLSPLALLSVRAPNSIWRNFLIDVLAS